MSEACQRIIGTMLADVIALPRLAASDQEAA